MSVRICNIIMRPKKSLMISLADIFGIGISTSLKILKKLEINPNTKIEKANENMISSINKEIKQNYLIENDLRQEIYNFNINHSSISCWRASRKSRFLPVKGSTRRNAKTCKKKRRKNSLISKSSFANKKTKTKIKKR